eukprot:Pgem_evm2s3104
MSFVISDAHDLKQTRHRCAGFTKFGTRCQKLVYYQYCFQHGEQAINKKGTVQKAKDINVFKKLKTVSEPQKATPSFKINHQIQIQILEQILAPCVP